MRNAPLYRLTRSLLVIIGIVLAAPAFADDSHHRMLELSGQATEAFRDGDYETAAQIFARAYDVFPEPILLRNQMIARFAIRQCEQSLAVGARLLKEPNVDADDRAAVTRVQTGCALSAAEQALADGSLDDVARHIADARAHELSEEQEETVGALEEALAAARSAEEEQAAITKSEPEEPKDPVVEPVETGSAATTAGWVLTGTGLATIGGATIWYLSSQSTFTEYEQVAAEGLDNARYEQLNGKLHTARWAIPTLYGLGGAMTVAGLYLALVQAHPDTEQPVVFLPRLSRDEVGASVFLRF